MMSDNTFEKREQILKLRNRILQAEQERNNGEKTMSVSEAKEALRIRLVQTQGPE